MKKKSNRNFWIATIIGLIGAAAWVPQIYDWTLQPDLEGKILSQYHNYGSFLNDTAETSIILQKLSLFSKKKDFFNKSLRVYLKFPDKKNEVEAKIIAPRVMVFTFSENNEPIRKRLKVNPDEHLIHMIVFPKSQSITGYLLFKLDFKVSLNYEYIRYVFQGYSEDKHEIIINSTDIKENELLHDESIWERLLNY